MMYSRAQACEMANVPPKNRTSVKTVGSSGVRDEAIPQIEPIPGCALTIEEVAALTQWSESTVRRIESQALSKLRDGCAAADISPDDLMKYLRFALEDL